MRNRRPLKRKGYEVAGVDLSPAMLKIASFRIKAVYLGVAKEEFRKSHYVCRLWPKCIMD